jgi:hypothetical protein
MRQPGNSVELRRAERELFFWTARQTLKLVTLTAITVYFVVSLVHGEPAGMRELLGLT